MLTFCVSVCYKNGCSGYREVNILRICMLKNGCSGYTEVNILRICMLQKWLQWLHGCSDVSVCYVFAYPYATEMDAVVTGMLTFLRIRMLQKWMQWIHGC